MSNNHYLKIYYLNKKYYQYLLGNNLDQFDQKPKRPYINLIRISYNGNNWCIPLVRDKNDKYKLSHKYSIFIPKDGNDKNIDPSNKLGILHINKMIPVFENENFAYEPSINQISLDHNLKNIVDELNYLNQPDVINKIYNLANEIYEKRSEIFDKQIDINTVNDTNIKYAVDFKQAEILMYKYAFDLYDNDLLDEEPLLPEWIGNYGMYNKEFRQFSKWLDDNGLNNDNVFHYSEGETIDIWLVKKNENTLTILQEIYCMQPDDDIPLFNRPELYEIGNINLSPDMDARDVFDLVDEKIENDIGYYFCRDMKRNIYEDDDELKNAAIKKINNWNLNIIKKKLDELIDDENDNEREM